MKSFSIETTLKGHKRPLHALTPLNEYQPAWNTKTPLQGANSVTKKKQNRYQIVIKKH